MPTMNHYDRDEYIRKTVAGYALLNISVYVTSHPYTHKTVLILLKELKFNLVKIKCGCSVDNVDVDVGVDEAPSSHAAVDNSVDVVTVPPLRHGRAVVVVVPSSASSSSSAVVSAN